MSDAYSSSRIDDLPTLWDGMCKLVRAGLGVTAFGVNVLDIGPDYVTTDHTESASGQEELYLVLEGEGQMWRNGDSFAVRQGDLVRNPPGGEHGLHNTGEVPIRLFVFELRVAH